MTDEKSETCDGTLSSLILHPSFFKCAAQHTSILRLRSMIEHLFNQYGLVPW